MMNDVLEPLQAKAQGYISLEDASIITGQDPSTLYRHAKAGKIASCIVLKGSRKTTWVLGSALGKTDPHQNTQSHYMAMLKEWEYWVQHGELSVGEEHMKLMRRHLKYYWQLLEEKPSIGGVSAEGFRKALLNIKEDPENQKCRISKKKNIKTALISFLKFLVHKSLRPKEEIYAVREIKLKAKYKPVREYMQELDVREALAYNLKWLNGRSQYDVVMMELLIYLYAFGGLRRAEAANLQLDFIDFKNEQLLVRGKGSKERLVPLDPELAEKIWEYVKKHRPKSRSKWLLLAADGDKVTPRSISRRFENFTNAWIKHQERSGSLMKKGIRTHKLRRSFAVIWTLRGKPLAFIQEDLGHTDIRVTKLYVPTGVMESKNFNKQYFNQHQPPGGPNKTSPEGPVSAPGQAIPSVKDMRKAAIQAMLHKYS